MLNKTKKTIFQWRHPCIRTLIDHGQRTITGRVAFTSLYKGYHFSYAWCSAARASPAHMTQFAELLWLAIGQSSLRTPEGSWTWSLPLYTSSLHHKSWSTVPFAFCFVQCLVPRITWQKTNSDLKKTKSDVEKNKKLWVNSAYTTGAPCNCINA